VVGGTCRLTLEQGKFAKAHIVPLALTRPPVRGAAMIQAGEGTQPVRRWTSWYDNGLVTAAGEQILAELDDWAIKELRQLRLVWSGWGPALSITGDHKPIDGTPWGIRRVTGGDWLRLRRFYLSILWRAAASAKAEFAPIAVCDSDLERLRKMILAKDAEPPGFYPIHLTQISTLGTSHNQAPIAEDRPVPYPGANEMVPEPSFRFYFDGLVAHIARRNLSPDVLEDRRRFVLGASEDLLVPTVTWDASRQKEAVTTVMTEYARSKINGGRR
jgi:hypothetical protein